MEVAKQKDVLNLARREIETGAKEAQDKGRAPKNASVMAAQVVVPLEVGWEARERISYLESEVDRLLGLSKTLVDCERALGMANDETDKANKVARGAKAKVVELDGRLYQAEVELQHEKFRAAELQRELTTYRAQQSELYSKISERSVIQENQETIKILSDRADKYKSQARKNEERAAELDLRSKELSKKVEDMESKLSEVGVVKEQIEAFVVKYKKELEVSLTRVSQLEDQLSHEQDESTSLQMENESLRKRLNAQTRQNHELEDRIAELERALKIAREVADAIAPDRREVEDAKRNAEEKHSAATRKVTSLVKENKEIKNDERHAQKNHDAEEEIYDYLCSKLRPKEKQGESKSRTIENSSEKQDHTKSKTLEACDLIQRLERKIKESEDKTEEKGFREELESARSRATEANFLSARLQEEMNKVEEMHKTEDKLFKEIAEARHEALEARKVSARLEVEMRKVEKLKGTEGDLLRDLNTYKVRPAEAEELSERLTKGEKQVQSKKNSVKKLKEVFERTNAAEARDFSRRIEDRNKKLHNKSEEQKIVRKEVESPTSRACAAESLSTRLEEKTKMDEDKHENEKRLPEKLAETKQTARGTHKLPATVEEGIEKSKAKTNQQVELEEALKSVWNRASEADFLSPTLEEGIMKIGNDREELSGKDNDMIENDNLPESQIDRIAKLSSKLRTLRKDRDLAREEAKNIGQNDEGYMAKIGAYKNRISQLEFRIKELESNAEGSEHRNSNLEDQLHKSGATVAGH